MVKYMLFTEDGFINNDLTTFSHKPHPDTKTWDDPVTASEYGKFHFEADYTLIACVLVPVPLTGSQPESKVA